MKKTNKVKIEIWATTTQRKDFMKAINDIKRQGAQDEGRAAQLLAISYLIEAQHYER